MLERARDKRQKLEAIFGHFFHATEGNFGGGEFIYNFMTKDCATYADKPRTVASYLGIVEEGGRSNLLIKDQGEDMDKANLLCSVLFWTT